MEHLHDIKDIDTKYRYEDLRIITLLKAKFCLNGRVEESIIADCYREILDKNHIDESSRGYKPAMAQYELAERVFKQFYSKKNNCIINTDDIVLIMYFRKIYGPGSILDCSGYAVMRFMRNVVVKYAEYNPEACIIQTICNVIVQCLKWDTTYYVYEFNKLFCISNLHEDFMKVAEYWCGDDGEAWKSEFDEMEACCDSVIQTLEYFEEYEFATRILEKKKYRMFGYVGRKDYSIDGLLECYKKIPLTEEKICDYGMKLLSVSNMANSIGDNRFSHIVDQELLDDAAKLGYKFFNALYEINNSPRDLDYWRKAAIEAIYRNIECINDDSELLSLYKLTNAWIKEYIERGSINSELETLKKYNQIVVTRISDPGIREELASNGLCDAEKHDKTPLVISKSSKNDLLEVLREEGYCEKTEKLVLTQIEKGESGLHNMIVEARNCINPTCLEAYANRCVVKYILSASEYGYPASGVREVYEHYAKYFSEESWKILYSDIIARFAQNDYGLIALMGGDFATLSLYYLLHKNQEMVKLLFNCICDTHEKLLSANGRIDIKKEKLVLKDDINSLSDMVEFQLNI